MFCPQCGAEFVSGVTTCNECSQTLVEVLPKPEPVPEEDLVTVLETGSAVELAVAKSILADAGIDCVTAGEILQDLDGAGRIGAGFNVIFGPVPLKVRESDRDRATALLAEIDAAALELPADEDVPSEVSGER